MKINRLEIENVKRIHAVMIEPSKDGLTIIGGKNRQGKSSVLDAIAWALGGNKYKPTQAANADSTIPPRLKVIMDNGLVVERKGKNSDLKVTDPEGQKGGQQLLDSFVEELAINLPKKRTPSCRSSVSVLSWRSWSRKKRACTASACMWAGPLTRRKSSLQSSPITLMLRKNR